MTRFMKTYAAALSAVICGTIAFSTNAAANESYTVEAGDSLWTIAVDEGVSVQDLQNLNGLSNDEIHPGTQLALPETITNEERDLLAQLVHAEAVGEPYAGKVAVATVVLNRVNDNDFPDSIRGVVYDVTPSGHYAFSPVLDDSIYAQADADSYQAVDEALAFEGQGQGSLFFYNPETAENNWNATRTETITIGSHVFSK
ncbi:N-acetylmuramoyl-L-alanine amidase [Salsuginibacillus halophilus]|uniref:N-acetylmuramoyl-L-alanine amidase n=1 Tax=Salsuginibacillus halophilus TaxID=517424 RepID=A0A2P8H883_9BACI|nr:cell wall hydrolase [Salsuginibacillus halophilus]PSL42445.1 N-acetylmuramoyl-L-alanine amidase [Salsuginibacillus halophilus]